MKMHPTIPQWKVFPYILQTSSIMFCSSHFCFWFLVTFGDKVQKTRKYYVIFVYILQGKIGKTEKNRKENHATEVTKISKTNWQKYGMNKTQVLENIKRQNSTLCIFMHCCIRIYDEMLCNHDPFHCI